MRKLLYCVAALALLVGCKPSEKHYKIAYETAQQRAREGLDEGIYELMQKESLPPLKHIGEDSVRVQRMRMIWFYTPAAVDSGRRIDPAPYNLAVALYSMPTNARAHADAIAEEGYRAVVLKTGSDKYYVMAGLTQTLDSAARLATRYEATHRGRFIGIPCPIAIEALR